METLAVRYHRLPEIQSAFTWPSAPSAWTFRRLLQDSALVAGWVSFDAVAFDPLSGAAGSIWCGLNVLDPVRHGILHRFDLATARFERAALDTAIEPFAVKIHKGIAIDGRRLIFGTASFLDAPDQGAAPGGKIIVYDTERGRVEACAVPVGPATGFPLGGQYIQSTLLDPECATVYGCTYPVEVFFAYDLATGRTRYLAHLQGTGLGQPHNLTRDARGRVWGTYGIRNGWSYAPNLYPVRPFLYDPATDGLTWLESCLPPRETPGDDPGSDALAAWGDWVYLADKSANLCRVHGETFAVEYLGKQSPRGRLPALIAAAQALWGVTGDGGDVHLLRVREGGVDRVGPIVAGDGERPERLHDLTYAGGGRFFAGENDNQRRSSYLWEIHVPPAEIRC